MAYDSITMAHVADALTEIWDWDNDYQVDVDYDAMADEAAQLLTRVPALGDAVARWNAGTMTREALIAQVRAARDSK